MRPISETRFRGPDN